jgi:hypothetical protein
MMRFLLTLTVLLTGSLYFLSRATTTNRNSNSPQGLSKFSYPTEKKIDWYPQTPGLKSTWFH